MTETPPGWYPDPSGNRGTRFWDGQAWTDNVQQAAAQTPPPAPAPEKKRGAMRTVCIVAAGFLVAGTVTIVGCAALIGGAANEVQKESDKTAITPAQYQSVGSDDTLDSVKAEFGEPSDQQDTEINLSAEEKAAIGSGAAGDSCIYYSRKGELASLYQFCFDANGEYQSKASY